MNFITFIIIVYIVLLFSFISVYPNYIAIYSLTHWLLKSALFKFYAFMSFLVYSVISSSILLFSVKKKVQFQSFKIYWDLFCELTYGLLWRIFNVHLRIMCILSLLRRVVCIYISARYSWIIVFKSSVLLLICYLNVLLC